MWRLLNFVICKNKGLKVKKFIIKSYCKFGIHCIFFDPEFSNLTIELSFTTLAKHVKTLPFINFLLPTMYFFYHSTIIIKSETFTSFVSLLGIL